MSSDDWPWQGGGRGDCVQGVQVRYEQTVRARVDEWACGRVAVSKALPQT